MAKPLVGIHIDLGAWARAVQDEEAHHDDFSGAVFLRYARGLFNRIMARLPPKTAGGGKRRIRRDYAMAYPRGRRLRGFLRPLKPWQRRLFWRAYLVGDAARMRALLRLCGPPISNAGVASFDGGKALRGWKRGRWAGKRIVPPLRVVLDPKSVDAHIRELDTHVGKLKSALNSAFRRLGITGPQYVAGKGTGRGVFVMSIREHVKAFDWTGFAREYDPELIDRLQLAIDEAAMKHVGGMREEMAGYRPRRG